MDEFYEVVAQLPPWLCAEFSRVPASIACTIHEIRFKTGSVPLATCAGEQTTIASICAGLCGHGFSLPYAPHRVQILDTPLTQLQVETLFYALCGSSVHSYEDELSQGFFTLQGGHRVGVGGRYLLGNTGDHLFSAQQKGICWKLQQVTSLNIRIARHKQVALPPVIEQKLQTRFTSILLLGEPDSGKTTLLRSMICQLAACNKTVAVIDERNELSVQGVDVIAGMEKSNAVQLALRTLSPEVIVLDEIGTIAELAALEQGFFGGADFIATLHASSFSEAARKPQFQYLQSHGMLGAACLLQGRRTPGCICDMKEYQTDC